MKTMFAAADNNTKKRFQKPNILRKSSKPPAKHNTFESLSVKNLVTASTEQESKFTVLKPCPNKNIQPMQRLVVDDNVCNEENSIGELYQIDGNVDMDRSLAVTCDVLTNNNEENVFEATINVDSFINNSDMEQMVSIADVENEISRRMKQEWCLDFINDTQEIVIEDIDGSHLGSLRLASSPASSEAAGAGVTSPPALPHTAAAPTQNITLEYMNCTMNFKCNIPNCSKRFRSEEALNKHQSTHTKAAKVKMGGKSDKPVLIECPVKKVFASGVEECCGVRCSSKKDIINHLNEAHDPEDAMYICAECGRRFYWAAGLRAHSRTHLRGAGGAGGAGGAEGAEGAGGAGGAWACGWAGCGRVFRQPCRLREHMRAHTGDKPYPCRHPNCGWSFRTASKLLRHARRHTGERRHACEQCGRAFRRREHLRDHTARHHAHKRACTHTGCPKKFHTVEALQTHLERVHNDLREIAELLVATAPDMPYIESESRELQPEQYCMVNVNSPELDEVTLEEVETTTVPTEAEANMSLQTATETGVILQAETGAGLMLRPETGMMLQLEAEEEAICLTQTEAGMMLQTGTEAGMMLQTETEAGIMLQTETETGMILQTDTEAGMMLRTKTEAGMMLTDTAAGMLLQPGAGAGAGSPRAARTHCTWPFPARALEPQVFEENASQEYVLEHDTTEEISEQTENNIYTIRSDLFLHGNVLNNEDSEQMGGASVCAVVAGEGQCEGPEEGEARGAGLLAAGGDSLLDAHPTSDLMQEELMYTDAAVDESSFRVFLLSGEELT